VFGRIPVQIQAKLPLTCYLAECVTVFIILSIQIPDTFNKSPSKPYLLAIHDQLPVSLHAI